MDLSAGIVLIALIIQVYVFYNIDGFKATSKEIESLHKLIDKIGTKYDHFSKFKSAYGGLDAIQYMDLRDMCKSGCTTDQINNVLNN